MGFDARYVSKLGKKEGNRMRVTHVLLLAGLVACTLLATLAWAAPGGGSPYSILAPGVDESVGFNPFTLTSERQAPAARGPAGEVKWYVQDAPRLPARPAERSPYRPPLF